MASSIKIRLHAPNAFSSKQSFSIRIKENIEPQMYELMNHKKLMAISDDHCSFSEFHNLLRRHDVIDRNFHWKFGDRILVILHKPADKQMIQQAECLWLIYAMQEKALKHGGYIYYLRSRMDKYNMPWKESQPNYCDSPKESENNVLYNGNQEVIRWLKAQNYAEKVNDFLFINEVVPVDIIQSANSAREINQKMHNEQIICTAKKKGILLSEIQAIITTKHAIGETIDLNDKLITMDNIENCDAIFIREKNIFKLLLDGKRVKIMYHQ